MGQRRQIAGSADGALLRHQRINLGVDQLHQRLQHLQPDAGETARQRVELEHHHQPHGGVIHIGADARSVGKHDGSLQLVELIHRDPGVGQQAKAGVDAVHHPSLLDHPGDSGGRGVDRRQRRRIQCNMYRLAADAAQGGKIQLARGNSQFKHGVTPFL